MSNPSFKSAVAFAVLQWRETAGEWEVVADGVKFPSGRLSVELRDGQEDEPILYADIAAFRAEAPDREFKVVWLR